MGNGGILGRPTPLLFCHFLLQNSGDALHLGIDFFQHFVRCVCGDGLTNDEAKNKDTCVDGCGFHCEHLLVKVEVVMPSKEIHREILETLNEAGIDHVSIEGIREWNGDNARKYAEALSWLNDKSLIETTEDDQLYDNKKHEFFSAKINSSGREFLENGCEFKNEPVTIRIDEKQLDLSLIHI